MVNKEAMKLALEALEVWKGYMPAVWEKTDEQAIIALREALAEQPAQQEPYGYVSTHTNGLMHFNKTFQGVYRDTATEIVAVYTSPPASNPLTNEEIDRALDAAKVPELPGGYESVELEIARAIEAAHGIKGGA